MIKILATIFIFLYLNGDELSELKPKYIYLKYEQVPKKIYPLEEFEVKIVANILYKKRFLLYSDIGEYENLDILDDGIIWQKNKDKFVTTLHFKVKDKQPIFPTFSLSILDENNTIIDKTTLKKIEPNFIDISKKNDFCKVIADDFVVSFVKTKQLSNNQFLTYIEMSAKNSNLQDFNLIGFNQTKEIVSNNDGIKELKYSIITPIYMKELRFSYFNKLSNDFIDVKIPIILKEDIVSTQEDINPTNNDLLVYKQIIIGGVLFIVLISYMIYKNNFFIILFIAILAFFIKISLPPPTIILSPNTKIYILPTTNSNIFKILKKEVKVKLLMQKNGYKKVLLDNNIVGWVKNEKN